MDTFLILQSRVEIEMDMSHGICVMERFITYLLVLLCAAQVFSMLIMLMMR